MRILFTGGSSFTGMWFIRQLASAGHAVTATFRRLPDDYADEVRRRRVSLAAECCRPIYGVSFGESRFLAVVKEERWDLFAHHAADAANYKSPDFDVVAALQSNTRNLPAVLESLAAGGCRKVLLTGSVFESGEGAGSDDLPDFSPYGLSKALTARVFHFYCGRAGLFFGKFVIPNPFGPYEEPRYTAYLMKSWLAGTVPSCANPLYVRDNIHVSLLARAYVRFAEGLAQGPGSSRFNPSGYAESQGAFTLRVAEAMRSRLGLPCPVDLTKQIDFTEPRIRINTDALDCQLLGWDEATAWDEMARYYRDLR